MHLKISSAICFNLDQSKILSSVKELKKETKLINQPFKYWNVHDSVCGSSGSVSSGRGSKYKRSRVLAPTQTSPSRKPGLDQRPIFKLDAGTFCLSSQSSCKLAQDKPRMVVLKHVRKSSRWLWKKSCVSAGVRKPGNTRSSLTAMI